jgi:hypothetical protein
MIPKIMVKQLMNMVQGQQISNFFKEDGDAVIDWLIKTFDPDVELQPKETRTGITFLPFNKDGKNHILGIIQTFNDDAEPQRIISNFDLEKLLQESDYDGLLKLLKENL